MGFPNHERCDLLSHACQVALVPSGPLQADLPPLMQHSECWLSHVDCL